MLDYNYFKNYYKMKAIDLSKQKVLDADPKAIPQINFTANLDWAGQTAMYFIIEEKKRNRIRFFTRNCESAVILFYVDTTLV